MKETETLLQEWSGQLSEIGLKKQMAQGTEADPVQEGEEIAKTRSSTSSPTRIFEVSLMVGSKHHHLHWSVASQNSQEASTQASSARTIGNSKSVWV